MRHKTYWSSFDIQSFIWLHWIKSWKCIQCGNAYFYDRVPSVCSLLKSCIFIMILILILFSKDATCHHILPVISDIILIWKQDFSVEIHSTVISRRASHNICPWLSSLSKQTEPKSTKKEDLIAANQTQH